MPKKLNLNFFSKIQTLKSLHNMSRNHLLRFFFVLYLLFNSSFVLSQSCSNYPYPEGISFNFDNNFQILSTYSINIESNKAESIINVREEAILEAKSVISRFITEDVFSKVKLSKEVYDSKSNHGTDIENNIIEAIQFLDTLKITSQVLIKKLTLIDECYITGELVRVTLGLLLE